MTRGTTSKLSAQPSHYDYKAWSESYGFKAKSGFDLTELQIVDVKKALVWSSSCNFAEVGCGKTAMSTVVALMRGNAQKLVIVPPILITPWASWLRKVSHGVTVYRGTPKQRSAIDVPSAHWLIVSHAIFRDDFPRLESELHESLEVIVDEAHALKNPQSVLFKKVQRLSL